MTAYRPSRSDRLRAAVPVAAIHVLIGLALLRGLGVAPELVRDEALKLFELAPETVPPEAPPPPPPPSPGPTEAQRRADPRPEGAASPPNLEARPTPIVAPDPVVELPVPPPIAAAPIAGTGSEASAGAAPIPGPGTGSGGIGTGSGSGRGGGGAGGGGGGGGGDGGGRPVRPPRWIGGDLSIRDLPPALEEAGIGGRVSIIYTVRADGRVTDCSVTRSSGNALLDATTCRLVEQRYRFEPARDRQGRAVPSRAADDHEWVVEIIPAEPPPERRRRQPW